MLGLCKVHLLEQPRVQTTESTGFVVMRDEQQFEEAIAAGFPYLAPRVPFPEQRPVIAPVAACDQFQAPVGLGAVAQLGHKLPGKSAFPYPGRPCHDDPWGRDDSGQPVRDLVLAPRTWSARQVCREIREVGYLSVGSRPCSQMTRRAATQLRTAFR